MIEIKNVSKVFRQKNREIHALQSVSLTIPKGRIFGVIGSSGAGKSTLIRCVNLLERPSSGEVIVDGQDLMRLSAKELSAARQEIGMIFQHFNLLASRTVSDNIALPLKLNGTSKADIKLRVAELLDLVGISEKANEYPANLSGGQKQRVAIARALAVNPKILLCDEATSALDPETTASILALLKDINQRFQITILLITHEMNVVKSICDEVAVISDGELIEQGKVSDIFAHPQTYLTKRFIASSLHVALPLPYEQKLGVFSPEKQKPVVKLEFSGESEDSPVFAEAAHLFGINCNIICAQMDYAGEMKFGITIVELSGKIENSLSALNYFRDKKIKVEVLGYV